MSSADRSPLGKTVAWPDRYDPSVLFPIARAEGRDALGLRGDVLPFVGFDLWTAYELAWLDERGKPCVGIAELCVPADSPSLIESKSLKLYLNSFAQARMDAPGMLRETLARDLSGVAGADVAVILLPVADTVPVRELEGECIDDLALDIDDYGPPNPGRLRVHEDAGDEALVSHLFRSNCPVTGQPDWASVQLRYRGPRIDRAGLLGYIVSFRNHHGFHEQCVENIFLDVMAHCRPDALSVYARFTRRGGIDINPWRATPGFAAPTTARTTRQ
ncbi:MAG TPA: NADPH-dependent 7-cyano-7-deazaguanine reductase QueF [Xanthomonadaceae bacterium]|nr:NADPH-dependent 7-cyano-7-deazaguanine reductase QueF [Xanthomonadaceae bacterium]